VSHIINMTTDTDINTGVTGMLRRKRSNEGILLCITFVLVAISPTLEAFPIIQTKHRCSALVVRHQQQLPQPNKQESLSIAADEPQFIIRGSPDDELSDQMWEDIQAGAPPKWLILKELLGINAFTYVLAGLIVVFLSLNAFLGPGWLGQSIGLSGTGTFTDVSPSFPDTIDLSGADYLL